MNIKQIERKIEHFNFPVFPQMLVQVQKVTSDEYSSAKDLSETILKDQSLTTNILSVANSAYYGFYGKVSTITQSIVVLGFDSVKNIALGLTVHSSLSAFMKEPCIKQFWEHSLATGVCAELLAEKMGYTPSEEAFVGGLIHDVGKLLLVQFYPEEYAEVERVLSEHEAYSHIVEASILGVTHCMVGEILAKKWGLPASLTGAITNHHRKTWGANMLTDIIAFSDFMIQTLPSGKGSEKIDQLINLGSTVLNLKKESINAVMQILAERLEEYCKIFEIRVDNLMAYTTMVEEEYAKLKKSTVSKKLSKKEEEMAILSEVSNAMISGRPQDEMIQMMLEGIIRIEGADSAILFLVDHEKSLIKGSTGLGKNAMEFCSAFSLPLTDDASIIVQSVLSGQRKFFEKPGDAQFPSSPAQEILSELEVASAYVIPLLIKDKALGAIIVAWEEAQAEREEKELQTLLLFANQASLILKTSAEAKEEKAETKRKRSNLLLDLD